jgi:hypothetical protein
MKESISPMLSDEEFKEVVKSIGEPVLKLLMTLIKKNLLCKTHEKMELEEFLLVLFTAVCTVDASIIKWVLTCVNNPATGLQADLDKTRFLYIKLLNGQLGVDVH